MRRHLPPSKPFARWFLAALLAVLPLATFAEVTLTTSVERISTAMPLATDAAATPAAVNDGTAATPALMSSPVGSPSGTTATAAPGEVFPGDVLRYTIVFENTSTQDVAAGSVVITNPLPEQTVYLEGSAMGTDTLITFSVDGEIFGPPGELLVGEGASARAATASDLRVIRWTYEPLLPAGASSEVSFELLIP